jgi:hypothetical protein
MNGAIDGFPSAMKLPSELKDPALEIGEMVKSGVLMPQQGLDYCAYWYPIIRERADREDQEEGCIRCGPGEEDISTREKDWEMFPELHELMTLQENLEILCGQSVSIPRTTPLAPASSPSPLESGYDPESKLPQDLVGYLVDSALALRTWLATEPRDKDQAIVFLHYCLDYWEDLSKRKRINNEIEDAAYMDAPRQIEQLKRLQEEMEKYINKVSAPVSKPIQPSTEALGRILWKGKKTDLGRVFDILRPLIGCTAADWERHSIGKEGEDLSGACDIHKGGTSRQSEISALASAANKMTTNTD